MYTLVVFPTRQDPHFPGPTEGGSILGPIATLLGSRPFKRVVLLTNIEDREHAKETADYIQKHFPEIQWQIETLYASLNDYAESLNAIQRILEEIQRTSPEIRMTASLTQADACVDSIFLFLAKTQAFPLELVQVKYPLFPSSESPKVDTLITRKDGATTPLNLEAFSSQAPFIDDLLESLGLYGKHPSFLKAIQIAERMAPHGLPVLLRGETGTGKDLFGKFIHTLSDRRGGPLLVANCAALPEALAESTLFGHKKGAFTGAQQNEPGLFRAAHGGTLFLDELGELSLSVQAKLLRVLEDGLVTPLGSTEAYPTDVRIIAATNQNLAEMVEAGAFREDLYYRLRAGEIYLPALRERPSDILPIALNVLKRINRTMIPPRQLSQSAMKLLSSHYWPGNIRDLKNTIERAAILSPEPLLEPKCFDMDTLSLREAELIPHFEDGFSLENYLSELRRRIIEKALMQSGGNQSEAARLLGISPQAVNKFVKTAQPV